MWGAFWMILTIVISVLVSWVIDTLVIMFLKEMSGNDVGRFLIPEEERNWHRDMPVVNQLLAFRQERNDVVENIVWGDGILIIDVVPMPVNEVNDVHRHDIQLSVINIWEYIKRHNEGKFVNNVIIENEVIPALQRDAKARRGFERMMLENRNITNINCNEQEVLNGILKFIALIENQETRTDAINNLCLQLRECSNICPTGRVSRVIEVAYTSFVGRDNGEIPLMMTRDILQELVKGKMKTNLDFLLRNHRATKELWDSGSENEQTQKIGDYLRRWSKVNLHNEFTGKVDEQMLNEVIEEEINAIV